MYTLKDVVGFYWIYIYAYIKIAPQDLIKLNLRFFEPQLASQFSINVIFETISTNHAADDMH